MENLTPILVVAIVVIVTTLLVTRRWSSQRLFLTATVFFVWTATSLFLDLHHHEGIAAQIGWLGLLGAGPIAVLLSVLAMMAYGREQTGEPGDG